MTLAWFRVGPGRFHLAETWEDAEDGYGCTSIVKHGDVWSRTESADGSTRTASSWSALMEAR